MIDRDALTARLAREVRTLVDDLRERADEVTEIAEKLEAEWREASEAGRTAHDLVTWREDRLDQVAVSWVLGCVFVRFCEDNRLVNEPLLSGTGEWRRWAADGQVEFFRRHPEQGERGFLEHVFTEAAAVNGLGEVFGEHNPIWQFGPSDDACRGLIELWRATDPETGGLEWDFTDDTWDTRFLGDLYQDLSEHAKKTYALLQTPEFVEEFILDRTLDPAIEEFGLDGHDGTGFRMIDPACGSGHFLLGGFDRLAKRWLEKDPASGRRAAAARALECVFGVDLNPFAAAIARFRLLVAALRFAEISTLAEAPNLSIQIAVGDSLLHGDASGRLPGMLQEVERQAEATRHLYATEDRDRIGRYLGQEYHAVVANPPYITPKDAAANQLYRDRFKSCHRQYSMSVPFMEQLFNLAVRGAPGTGAGFVGQITANSFMKREFGKKLIEDFLATQVDLTHVIDTSGAYIPGHGTPTVILIGRDRGPLGETVRAVLGIRGEPSAPPIPAHGNVWRSIVELIDRPGSENEYVSTIDHQRSFLARHPWSLQGGAAAPLKESMEQAQTDLLGDLVEEIGFGAVTREDEVFRVGRAAVRGGINSTLVRPLVAGEEIRDWDVAGVVDSLWPYDEHSLQASYSPDLEQFVWPWKAQLSNRVAYGKSQVERGLFWWEFSMFFASRFQDAVVCCICVCGDAQPFRVGSGWEGLQPYCAGDQVGGGCW